jgi:hypothetical protein
VFSVGALTPKRDNPIPRRVLNSRHLTEGNRIAGPKISIKYLSNININY